MDYWLLTLFVATEFMFSTSPGPAVAAVVSSSILGGYRLAILATLGVLVANLLYFIVSAFIIAAGTRANEDYFWYIKILGAAYLLYVLYTEYFSKNKDSAFQPDDESVNNNETRKKMARRFTVTFAMQMANPKTIVFFAAFLPQFINVEYNINIQLMVLAFLSFVTEFVVLMMYAAGGQVLLKYGSEKYGEYAGHIGNIMMVVAIVWSFLRSS